ncbi:MAG: Small ribosomal subunit biosis GTPase RsgA [Candidatus Acidoferrum typicum]|nr:Small ribosomal subunit biosis GTPase RsgA [Candidatus Acidoferrum typicum]
MSINQLGWNSHFDLLWQGRERAEWLPARVISQQRGLWRVAGDFEECWAETSGTLRVAAETGGDWPAVGDWIAVEMLSGGGRPLIHKVLPRRSKFVRKVAGRRLEEQVIAANVDTAFVVMALDGDFNVRRLERYLAQSWESGAKSIVVLNKADDCGDVTARISEVQSIAAGVQIFAISARTGEGVEALDTFLASGQTIVLLGSSGVGKSTLVNHFLQRDAQAVRSVRASDSRGRHTTTSRELFALPGGALLIDTPGLRELQLWGATEGVERTFSEIEELATQCKYGNCGHTTEPGCAVQAALGEGRLDKQRLESWRKLEREQEFVRRKIDPGAQQQEKERVKQVHRGAKQKYDQRRKDGGKF